MGIAWKGLQACGHWRVFGSVQENPPLSFWLYQSQCAALWMPENIAGDSQGCQNNDLLSHGSTHLEGSWNSKSPNTNLIWIYFWKMEYIPTKKEDS